MLPLALANVVAGLIFLPQKINYRVRDIMRTGANDMN
jgi:hypothetical protein